MAYCNEIEEGAVVEKQKSKVVCTDAGTMQEERFSNPASPKLAR